MSKKMKTQSDKSTYIIYINYDMICNDESFDFYGELTCDDETKFSIFEGHKYFIYAIARNKKLVDQFFAIRNRDKYLVLKVKQSQSEFFKFMKTYHMSIINVHEFEYGNSTIDLALTDNEYETYDNKFEWMIDEFTDIRDMKIPINILYHSCNKKALKNLDNVGISNIMRIIRSIEIGESVYVSPNIISVLMDTFAYAF